MWGGWYDDPLLMDAITEMKHIYDTESSDRDTALSPEVAFFADEQGFAELLQDSEEIKAISKTRTNMGTIGTPFDSVMVEDAEKALPCYRAAIFPMPIPSTMGKQVLDLCKHHKIPVLTATESHPVLSSEEIRAFLSENGIHLYTEEDAVVYVGNGYIAYHSVTGGIKALRLPKPLHLSPVFGASITAVSECEIFFTMSENGSALFTVS